LPLLNLHKRYLAKSYFKMLDRPLAAWIKPSIDGMAAALIGRGLRADALTVLGFTLGIVSSGLIASQHFLIGLALLWASRLCDGLDGAMARQTQTTDRGGFLDITLDFIFYASVPLAFALTNPQANALAAATLLFAFMGTSTSFLAYASIAAKRPRIELSSKAIHYLGGLTEAFETYLCFSLMCIWPEYFSTFAYGFAAMCAVTTASRIYQGWHDFKNILR
jgi:phosphatidylglycerophosphate synthase